MAKKWNISLPHPKKQVELSDALGIHPIVAQLLINRGLTDPQEAGTFLSADLAQTHDPFLMKGMAEAVARVRQAQEKQERVLIFGDYDVDGVTSAALLNRAFAALGLEVLHQIPHRVEDGYGLNAGVAQYAAEERIDLVITVDCGVTAVDEVQAIRDQGIDVLIIDHHEPAEAGLPQATVIVDPKQADCGYPFKELASVGLVTKFIQALTGKINEDILDLTAIGTVADIVPLRGENRIFVKNGLPKIRTTKNKGLQALLKITKLTGKDISPFHIGFILGPRINAAGRMESAHTSLDLFLTDKTQEALQLAKVLDRYNQDRQKTQRLAIEEAVNIVEQQVNFKEEKVIVLHKEGWHKGVIGIIASKLADKYYRPSIVISTESGIGTASCRSIDGFHIQEALELCAQWLENFGGHEGAAGLTIRQENIDPFRKFINEVADRQLEIRKLAPVLAVDCEIPLPGATLNLAKTVDTMQPFGEGNSTPVFCSRKVEVQSYPQILSKETLKFWVESGGYRISAIGFGMAKYADMIRPGEQIDLAYELTIDDWNKEPQPQLRLKDIRLSEG